MTPQRRKTIIDRVKTILEEQEVSQPPVPIEKIAKRLGSRIRFSPLDDELSGMIHLKDGTPIIGVNSLHHPNRQRFTLAHECGHLVLHKAQITREVHIDKGFPMMMRDSVSAAGIDEMEIEANLFAAEILMPHSLLNEALNNDPIEIDDEGAVTALARSFKVSPSAMRYRLGNLFV